MESRIVRVGRYRYRVYDGVEDYMVEMAVYALSLPGFESVRSRYQEMNEVVVDAPYSDDSYIRDYEGLALVSWFRFLSRDLQVKASTDPRIEMEIRLSPDALRAYELRDSYDWTLAGVSQV